MGRSSVAKRVPSPGVTSLSRREVEQRRLAKKARRAWMRKRWGMSKTIGQAAKDGDCAGVPELGHEPHTDSPAANVDHIIPRSLGGADGYENLRPVCIPIHRRLTTKLNEHRAAGLGVDEWIAWQLQYGVEGALKQ